MEDQGKEKGVGEEKDLEAKARAKDGEKDLEARAKERDSASMGEEKGKVYMDWRVQLIHGEAVRHGALERERDLEGAICQRNG